MIKRNHYSATIIEKTDSCMVLSPDQEVPGHIISCINEGGIKVGTSPGNTISTEGCAVLYFKDNWLNTVFALYKVGDKIGVELERIKKNQT